jgi:putative N6-adenine-specific DNA methylase
MCGSGTLLTEAALIAHRIAPGLLRQHWSLTDWHDFDSMAWRSAKEEARAEARASWESEGVIAGNDVHEVLQLHHPPSTQHLDLTNMNYVSAL